MVEQPDALEVRVLGPMQIRGGDGPIALGGAKQRTLLALLVLSAGEVVPVERIVDELWGDAPPATAAQSVQMHVSRLRRSLATNTNGSVLVTRPSGYRLDAKPERIDARRFEQLFESGQRSRRAGDTASARQQLETALGLWRGEALVDVERGPVLATDAARLNELRLTAQLERIECDLELGRHADVVAELEALASRHPLQERVRALLMLALYRCGRQADALEVYHETRRLLVDELGLEPTQRLQELQARILRHDATLAPPAEAEPRAPSAASSDRGRELVPRRRALVLAGTVLVAVAVIALALIGLRDRDRSLGHIDADAVGALDLATGRVVAQVQTGGRPVGLAQTRGALWLADGDRGQLVRIEPRDVRAVDTVPIGSGTTAVAAGAGAVWAVSSETRSVAQVNVTTNTVVRRITVGNGARAVAVGAGDVWVANALDGTVSQIQPHTGRELARIPVGAMPSSVTGGAGAVWVANESDGTVTRIDPRRRTPVATVRVGNGPAAIAAGTGGVWVANALDGTVSRIDPQTNAVTATVGVDARPAALAIENDRVWVANSGNGTISRLDAHTGQVTRSYRVGGAPSALATGAGRLWAAEQPAPGAHRGGTLVMAGGTYPEMTVDPASAYDDRTYALLAVVADGLVGHRRVAGAGGAALVPDLARTIPAPADGGLTYRFQLRPGLHYSTGAPVRASDVRASIERLHRMAAVTLDSYPLELRGQDKCSRARCDLSAGIVTDNATGTVTFHLRRPNPDFLLNLAEPPYVLLPGGSPPHDLAGPQLIGTGPYRVASASATQVTLARNPRFHAWSAEAQPEGFADRIVWRITKPGDDAASRAADLTMDPDPATTQRLRLSAPTRVRITPYPQVSYVWLNTRVAPFDHADARRAVAYAIDRRALARAFQPPGSILTPNCQLLSPGLPGYDPYCPYASDPGADSAAAATPDLDRARRLVVRSGTTGMRVTLWVTKQLPASVRSMLLQVLRGIGYRATFNARFAGDRYFAWTRDAAHRTQSGVGLWIADIPTASNVIPPLLSCAAAEHRGPYPNNQAQFCDKTLDALMHRAHALEATEPAAANRLWARIDHEIVRRAPIVPFFSWQIVHVTSTRLANYQYNLSLGPLVAQAWVR